MQMQFGAANNALRLRGPAKIKAFQKTEYTVDSLKQAQKAVVEFDGTKVLLTVQNDTVYAVANKCSHLGLPIQGKTAIAQATFNEGCVVCPFHNTNFDLATGEVKGEWCPKMPTLPVVGKVSITEPKPLPTFKTNVTEDGTIEVDI